MKKLWLILTGVLTAAALTVTAFAADPVLSVDFADGDNGFELVEAELVDDATRGQVLEVNGKGPTTTGTSYAVLKTDLFKTTNWDEGMTINMWVKSAVSETLHGTAPIFSLDIANVGYIGLVTSLEAAFNTDGNDTSLGISPRIWCDPANVGGGMCELDQGVWQYVSLVFGEENLFLYVDGELVSDQPFANGNANDFTNMISLFIEFEEVYSLRLGSWLCSWWNYGDFEGMIDDVTIYNCALTEDEIGDLYNGTAVEQTEFEHVPTVEELYTATYAAPVYTADLTKAELNNAELVSGTEHGDAVQIKGIGAADNTNGTSYALITDDFFSTNDWTNGMTVSLWVKPDESETLLRGAPLYSFDISNQGYIGVTSSLQSGINTTGNEEAEFDICWNDPSDQGGTAIKVKPGEWQNVIVTYSAEGMAIYQNGEVIEKPGINGAGGAGLLDQMKYVPSLRLGSWLCSWWQNGDFQGQIADVEIYNVVLNPLEAKQLYNKTGVFAEGAAETTAPETTAPETTAPETEVVETEAPVETEVVEAPVADAETTETVETETTAPQTFDAAIIAVAAAVMSLGSAVALKKRK